MKENFFKLYGRFDKEAFKLIVLYSIFFVSLTCTTLSILNVRNVMVYDIKLSIPIGILFFPITFVISNIIQSTYNIRVANTIAFMSLIFDGLLMLMLKIIVNIGVDKSYYDLINPLLNVWSISFISITVSCLLNNIIFKKLNDIFGNSNFAILFKIFCSSSSAEILLSCISLPAILRYSHDSLNNVSVVIIVLAYKLLFTFIASVIYVLIKSIFEYTAEKE